jgi:hypothetical protein
MVTLFMNSDLNDHCVVAGLSERKPADTKELEVCGTLT